MLSDRIVDDACRTLDPVAGGEAFDLNIEVVLEHWPVSHAVRELLANALDEHHLTGTPEPTVTKLGEGRWEIRDLGRGLRYEHLTQKENAEKLGHPAVIGQFGIGLKDALAVFDRRGVDVTIQSAHGDITTARRPKAGFPDVVTLHGVVAPPSEPDFVGTRVVLAGVADADIETARAQFRRYRGDVVLEETKLGVVLARDDDDAPGRVYVKGLLVAEEPSFLFSYDITDLNAPLRRALNRERSNVGRTAYSDRVKDILRSCTSTEVASVLAADLGRFASGGMHDELGWKDVAIHACRVLQTAEKVVFVTPRQVGHASVAYARDDGYRAVIVPDDIARALRSVTDLDGNPMVDLRAFQEAWNESFTFDLVDRAAMTAAEQDVFDLTDAVLDVAGIDVDEAGIEAILVSETMRIDEGGSEIIGVFDHGTGQIVIRRDQLASLVAWAGTLLHEASHAASGAGDCTFAFEEELTHRLGAVAEAALRRAGD
jgi:hypothetical protein